MAINHHIKDILNTLFKQQEQWKVQLLQNWQTILGDLSKHVRLEKMYDDTLVLGVYDSAWMQELYLLSYAIIATINQNLDQPRIKKLHFKNVEMKRREIPSYSKKTQELEKYSVTLSPKEKATLEPIKDEELKKAMEQYRIRCLREK